jgi:hypothetical protein
MTDSMRALWRDCRGAVPNIFYVMALAGIVFVALPAVRGLTTSAKATFEDSTTRFDRPGEYVGGDVQYGPNRSRSFLVDSTTRNPYPPGFVPISITDDETEVCDTGSLGADPDWEDAGKIDIIHPDGRVEEDVSIEEVQRRIASGELGHAVVNGSLNTREGARTGAQARADCTGEPQIMIYYPQDLNYWNTNECRARVRARIAAIRDAAMQTGHSMSWSCHSHSCHFTADELRGARGQTLDAYNPAHNPNGQDTMFEDALRGSEMDCVTIYRGTRDMVTLQGSGSCRRDEDGGDCGADPDLPSWVPAIPGISSSCGDWNDEVCEAIDDNDRVDQVDVPGQGHQYNAMMEAVCAGRTEGTSSCQQ